MARHKDIERAHALLEGEGWHIEKSPYIKKTDRPDKRRCIFYDKIRKICNSPSNKRTHISTEHLNALCIGNFKNCFLILQNLYQFYSQNKKKDWNAPILLVANQ